MSNMKKKACDSSNNNNNNNNNNSDRGNGGDLKQKERHIVSWSKEEDDILREQIGVHGTNNWAIIASKFENKSTRQCRRRWFNYLNSDFKRGGWSPEEDRLLFEAQKVFGNRWTEIAKVVPGRTDNAVKNRFSVLCKKRAKCESSTKENNANNKRTIMLETSMHPMKTRRKHIVAKTEDCNLEEGLVRPPFAVLNTSTAQVNDNSKKGINACSGNMVEGTFLKNDDLKIASLTQQAEMLNSPLAEYKNELKNDVEGVCPLPNSEFNSPLEATPLFKSMAQGIPSPQFSESERNYLVKTLGMESTPSNTTTTGTSQSPPCKRALLHCL